nr:MCP four helix bundle domain-containing protein [Pectobacterium sp. PL152]
MSIKIKLISVMLLMALLLLVVSVTGLFGMNHTNQSIKTLYQDRLIALGYLDNITRQVNNVMFEIASVDLAQADNVKLGLEHIAEAQKIYDEYWDLYSKTYLTGDEKHWKSSLWCNTSGTMRKPLFLLLLQYKKMIKAH